jgi:hypothetical protein
MIHDELTPAERQALARERMQDRIRAGMKAMLEEIMEEEMTEHLHRRNSCDSYREQTPGRRGERNGSYTRGLITEVGRIEQLKVPPLSAAHWASAVSIFTPTRIFHPLCVTHPSDNRRLFGGLPETGVLNMRCYPKTNQRLVNEAKPLTGSIQNTDSSVPL